MPEKKKLTKPTSAANNVTDNNENETKKKSDTTRPFHKSIPIILAAAALFTAVSFIMGEVGAFGSFLAEFLMGLFARGAYAVPVLLVIHALYYLSDIREKRLATRIIFSIVTLVSLSAMIYGLKYRGTEAEFLGFGYYTAGISGEGGGLIGGMLGYLLYELFGYVGIIIIAVAIFAIYVTYFFSKGSKTIKKIFSVTIKAFSSLFKFVKRVFKKIVSARKKSKDDKRNRALDKKSMQLANDEFFDVDNGIESLTITELGINETRSRESVESRPPLHKKVHHKSEFFDDEPIISKDSDTYFKADFTEISKKGKKVINDFDDDFDTVAENDDFFAKREEKSEKTSPSRIDSNADDIFTSGFDPFSLAHSQELANKPSSKTADNSKASYSESINELTEEDVERARRNAAFERRKAEVIENARRAAEEAEAAKKNAEVTITESNQEEPKIEIRDEPAYEESSSSYNYEPTQSTEASDTASASSFVQYDQDKSATDTDTVNYNTAEKKEYPSIEFSTVADTDEDEDDELLSEKYTIDDLLDDIAKAEDEQISETLTTEFSFDKDEKTRDTENEFKFFNFRESSDNEPKEESTSSYFATASEEKKEPLTFEFKDELPINEAEQKPGLIFEVEGEFKPSVKEEEPETILIERTKLNSEPTDFVFDEEEEDEKDFDESIATDDESNDEPVEIPPEKQNPKIMEYRDMFKMYRDESGSESGSDNAEEDNLDQHEDKSSSDFVEIQDEDEPLPFERDIPPVQKKSPFEKPKAPEKTESSTSSSKKPDYSNYQFPPIDLLVLDEVQNDDEISKEIEQNTNTLIETLASFNVTASIKGVDRGPRVTRYEVVPARGVKVNAITNLFDNIALNLAAEGIRMEAPIPGKSAIGFEIPNKRSSNVRLRELLECEEFVNAKSKTFVCIGKDVGGNPVFGDIAKFPHALVAGATGMGKSVCINSIMISLLYKARPDEVKFIMIDPKKVEFRMYSGIPHLLIPVITEAKQAAGALMWAVEEMERRYSIIEQLNIRNIETYNEKCHENKSFGEPMPKIVIVIDELNDLMMQVRDPVEDLIMRIAQKARAAGIHLIIGTQRPDVKVVTGTIKANINTRISCKVTSVVDSRTILEMAGAEKLLNRGDMLFKPVDKTKPIRVQGCYVSDPEVEAIMDFLKSETNGNIYDDEVYAEINRAAQKCGNKKSQGSFDDDADDSDGEVGYYGDQQFLDAVELAIRSGKVSTSLLQRKLSIGYGKAAKFIDAMEDIGIVSEQNGQKPRDILLSMDEWHEKLSRVSFDD